MMVPCAHKAVYLPIIPGADSRYNICVARVTGEGIQPITDTDVVYGYGYHMLEPGKDIRFHDGGSNSPFIHRITVDLEPTDNPHAPNDLIVNVYRKTDDGLLVLVASERLEKMAESW